MNCALVIIIIIFCISIVGPIIINNKILSDLASAYNIKQIKDIEFRTGDLLLYKWNYSLLTIPKNKKIYINKHSIANALYYNALVTYISDTFFHGGVVVIYNNKPYILELTEEDTFCNFDNKIAHYVPSLTSLDDMLKYKGAIYRCPYIGPEIDELVINDILQTKNQYIHAWHPDYGMINNIKYYLKDNMPNYDTCGPENKKLSAANCPYYVNCVQFVCAMLDKMKIYADKHCMKTTPSKLIDYCSMSDKYGDGHIIETPYIMQYF